LAASNFVFTIFVFAQQKFDFSSKNFWLDKPEKHLLHKQFDSASAVYLSDDKEIEYKQEGNEIVLYTTYHKIVRVNTDKGIEQFNKVYIVAYKGTEVQNIKARAILTNGKIINVDVSNVKQIEEEGTPYKIFTIDGLEKGAEAEYVYTIKRNFSVFGTEYFQNAAIPCQEASFRLITPAHLRYSAKGYNGLQVSNDSLIGDKRIIVATGSDIPNLENEKYAFSDKYLKRIDYKLSYNLSKSETVRLYTWKEYAKRVYEGVTERTDKDEKALDAFINQMKIDRNATEEAKISFVEDYIKSNINIDKTDCCRSRRY